MAWNGSGSFARVHNWVSDRDASIPITATRADAEDDNFKDGIEACLTKNGENSATANLPMGGYKHTGVANASARNQYAAAGQVQDGSFNYAVDSGLADAYVITPAPAISAYAAGQRFHVKITNTNTGASTLNVNGVGVTAIKRPDGSALSAGDLATGRIYSLKYDGTNFVVESLDLLPANDQINGAAGKTTPVDADEFGIVDSAASNALKKLTWANLVKAIPQSITIACSDETTNLTTGTSKVTFRMPYAMTLTDVRASVTTAPTGSAIVVDINESGTTLLSTKLTIDASEKTSTTAATAAVISDSALADDAEITIDIDQVGSTIAGKGLKVTLIGTRT